MDYSVRVPVTVSGSDISNAIQSAADLEDSAIAQAKSILMDMENLLLLQD